MIELRVNFSKECWREKRYKDVDIRMHKIMLRCKEKKILRDFERMLIDTVYKK